MGFLDTLLGRSKPVRPNLDDLFALPGAAITLEAATGFRSTNVGSVCFKPAEGAAFQRTEDDIEALLPNLERSRDSYGYLWLVCRSADLESLVTDVHGVNSTLQDAGFGPSLLCSLFGFADEGGRRLGLVYLYKRGTFYPFAPTGPERRDNSLEMSVRAALGNDLKQESDLARWFPVWGAPGL